MRIFKTESIQFDSSTIMKEFMDLGVTELTDYSTLGIDGMNVYCLVKYKSLVNFFNYWTPEIDTAYEIFVAIISYNHFRKKEVLEYLEHLNDYIVFMLPFACNDFEKYQELRIYS
ncbi:MAG: hypothetical protein SFU98_14095 [Leptospiraceae bacterium]|nr:hypothetical protein [Leptospiraceae bacterium]